MRHTKQQIENWKTYEDVRIGGMFNMLTPQARMLTGLDKEDYWYCIKNYATLKKCAKVTK